MRIAFVTYEYSPFIMGGAGTYAKNITEELAKLGHQVTVFTPAIHDYKKETPQKNLEIIRIKVNKILPLKALQFWLKLSKEVKKAEIEKEFDIVHINGRSYFSLRKRITKAPQTIAVHHSVKDTINFNKLDFKSRFLDIGGEDGFLMPIIEKSTINSAENIIVPSKFTKKRIIYHYKIDPALIEVINYGIKINNDSAISFDKFKEINNLNNDKKLILFVGRVNDYRKGLDMLLKAFKNVFNEFNSYLVVVGAGNPEKAMDLAKSLNILDNILFAGYVDEITLQKYYDLCDVYVCPSRFEGFGFTILEAMAAGKPVVAFIAGSIPELIKNNYNGILIEKNNIEELTNAICFLLNDGKLGWSKEERIKYLKENFGWKISAEGHERIFSSLVA